MLTRALVQSLLVLAGCLAGGSLECSSRTPRTPLAARGEEIYARMCAVCHGSFGEGYKADHAPALAHPDFLASVTDEFLKAAIANGRSGTTMSAWASEHAGPLSRP